MNLPNAARGQPIRPGATTVCGSLLGNPQEGLRFMRPARSRFRLRLATGFAALLLAAVPAAATAGLPNAVIGAGKVQGHVVLQNSHQRTIYMSTRDQGGRSSCYGYCVNTWTPVLTGSRVFARSGSGVNQRLLGTTRRRSGKLQVTYNHHPLYTSTLDNRPGDDQGEGCTDLTGHSWWMLDTRGNSVRLVGCQGY
jgi:predicted lipoprotein with Yx(FWY)xxD motif